MKFSIITPTHNPQWLAETARSVVAQSYSNWEWIVAVNSPDKNSIGSVLTQTMNILGEFGDQRIKLFVDDSDFCGIGARKKWAFGQASGDIVVELDHDDLLDSGALEALYYKFSNPEVGFVYSDLIYFKDTPQGKESAIPSKEGWSKSGWQFSYANVDGVSLDVVKSFKPSAASLSLIHYAPDHLRAWRKTVYDAIGGHAVGLPYCDDHELLCRTYLNTRMELITRPLYLYRVSGENSWAKHIPLIHGLTRQIRSEYLERLVLREASLQGMGVYDLGGGINGREGWETIDISGDARIKADLRNEWPMEDSGAFAFRASDFLEHLPNKQFTVSEIHRCLRPGGWLLSATPSTRGAGAWMDPTHCSYWNRESWWYYTRDNQAKYIRNNNIRFIESELRDEDVVFYTDEPPIPYVISNLVALKPGYDGPRLLA